jgi:hypothetical protein
MKSLMRSLILALSFLVFGVGYASDASLEGGQCEAKLKCDAQREVSCTGTKSCRASLNYVECDGVMGYC